MKLMGMSFSARLGLAFMLGSLGTVGASEPLEFTETAAAVTVRSGHAPTWSATVDKAHGGIVSELRVPENGLRVVSEKTAAFNLFFMTYKQVNGRTIKGWMRQNGQVEESRITRRDGFIVVELRGKASTRQQETMIEYRHIYTFKPDRIVCEGQARWVFPDTTLDASSMGFDFAPDAIANPLRIKPAGGQQQELDVTAGTGTNFAPEVRYPIDTEAMLRNGHRIVLRALELPAPYTENPRFIYERPWQTDFVTRFFLEGDTDPKSAGGKPVPLYPANQPISYRYELVIPETKEGSTPPITRIESPKRDIRYYGVGEEITLTGSSVDKEDGRIPDSKLKWEIIRNQARRPLLKSGTGSSITFTIPEDTPFNQDYTQFIVRLSATDSKGASGWDYTSIGVTPPFPRSDTISSIEWNFSGRKKIGNGVIGGETIAVSDGTLLAGIGKAVVKLEGTPPSITASRQATVNGEVAALAHVGESLHAWVTTRPGTPPEEQLASSTNGGKVWQLQQWKFPSAAAAFYPVATVGTPDPDGFVYFYGSTWPKGTSPCLTCRSGYLARVPKDRIGDQSAYEYFSYKREGKPLWAKSCANMYDIMADADGLDILSASYHPVLKRILLTVATGKEIRILEAENPWGPFFTVATYSEWDGVKPTPNLRITMPAQWATVDGGTIWAAYSTGNEIFVVKGVVTRRTAQ